MKKHRLLTILFALFAIVVFASPQKVNSRINSGDRIEIGLPDTTKGHLHAPAFIPICAEYDEWSSSVIILFLRNVGNVDIDIANSYSIDIISESVNSFCGSYEIPMTGTPGLYTITFTLESGKTYVGEFEIQ